MTNTRTMPLTIACPHWRDAGLPDAGVCNLERYKGRPSHGTCRRCLGLVDAPKAIRQIAPALPVILTATQRERVARRRAICERCPRARRFTRVTVHCEGCGCAGLSLLNGRCPEKRWPNEAEIDAC